MEPLVIGIQGNVLALDRTTGQELWRTALKGMSFVNVILNGEHVLATTKAEIFCLDRKAGAILWHNPLKGLGQGLVTIATDTGSTQAAVFAEKLHRDAAAAAAAGAGAAGAG